MKHKPTLRLMNKNRWLILATAILLSGLLISFESAGEDKRKKNVPTPGQNESPSRSPEKSRGAKAPDIIKPVLDAVTEATTRYIPVTFLSHKRHIGLPKMNCATCHHDIKGNGGKTPKRCSNCHNKPDAKINLKDAMHTTCVGCHLEMATPQRFSPPRKCLGCHKERP